MLDQTSKETYRSIRLSRDLRPDILARHAEKTSVFSVLTSKTFLQPAAALCSLALIVTVLFIFLAPSNPGIYMGDTAISPLSLAVTPESVEYIDGVMRFSADPTATEAPTRTANTAIRLRMEFGENVYFAVQDGILLLSGENGAHLFAGQAGEVKNGAEAIWVVDDCDPTLPLSAQVFDLDGKILTRITLTYNAADGIWQIARNMSDQ